MIYLGMSPWEGMWRNRHQLMSRFARFMPVLYVEPWVRARQLRTGAVGLRGILEGLSAEPLRRTDSGVHVLASPPHRAVSHSRRLKEASLRRWTRWVARHAADIGITQPILWLSQPGMGGVLGKLNESLSIYHVVDEYGGYTGTNASQRARLQAAEDRILDGVDLSIVVSEALEQAKKGPGRRVEIVPNAVDYEAFRDAAADGAEPADIAAIPRPRVGYSGLIGVRLDLALVDHLAERLPDTHFIFVGQVDRRECDSELRALEARDNIHFVGQKTVAEVPDYVGAFDAGLLPYRMNLETAHISPLKLYEYLAAGLPVVSTPIPAALPFSSMVEIAGEPGEFQSALKHVLDSDNPAARAARQELASRNTWDDRVASIVALIASALKARSAPVAADGAGS
jgi:glycosyltransferase involved in cell wall biosynthesis